jgi:lysine-specific demethylase/histidyl-hydroxylase NO66
VRELLDLSVHERRSPALARCVGDVDRFLGDTWGRRAGVHTGAEGADRADFADLLSLEDVDRILSTASLRSPAIRMVRGGTPLPTAAYTRSGRTGSQLVDGIADPARMFELFRQGATIVLQGVHRFFEPVRRFCRDLELELGHACQVNAYITPPGAQGLALHADPHDVLVLQAFGRKDWEVHAAPGEQERDPLQLRVGPGDAIYMPMGTPHAARTQDVLSGHLTVGIHVFTWRDVAGSVWRQLAEDPSMDERLDGAYHRDAHGFAAALDERLRELRRRMERVDTDAVARRRIDGFLSTRAPLVAGVLVDEALLADIDDATTVSRRAGSVCELRPGPETLTLLLGDRLVRMPAWLEPAVRHVSGARSFAIGDLAGLLDRQSRLVLVRRLVREGLLQVDPAR